MSSLDNPPKDLHTSPAARKRVRARYRAQGRLKVAGMLAIALAGFALAALLYSILSRAAAAVTETYITMEVVLDEATLDPDGKRDPEKLYSADYASVIKASLRKEFPGLGRRQKRGLYKLVSDAAAFELRDFVVKNPGKIGQTVTVDLLADDNVDLFVKRRSGKVTTLPAEGLAHPVGGINKGDDITLYVQSNSLDAGLNAVKAALAEHARTLERQAIDQKRAAETVAAEADGLAEGDARKKLLAQKKRYRDRYDFLMKEVNDLDRRAQQSGGDEKLDSSLPSLFVRLNGGVVKASEVSTDRIKGKVVLPLSSLNDAPSGKWHLSLVRVPEDNRKISDDQIIWLEKLQRDGQIKSTFNWHFFTNADASEPEEAGILGGLLGTFWTMLVTFVLSVPVGVLGALYLEEFAPKNSITHFIEVNINNLAAIPSIVFGLLGLAVFVNFFGLPYSSALVGGIVLSLMTLPTIIIASRAAIKAVPPSIREAALGIGASKVQTVFHHVLPLAMPGILTGSIIGMAQALGETAPLLMIGMVAFIVEPPLAVTEAASSLPVLVYLWADRAEVAFDMRTAAAITMLLLFLVTMNGLAIMLRKRFERRW